MNNTETPDDSSSKCRVCGFQYENYYPWGEDNSSPSYDICVCCGAEFGFDDENIFDIRQFRKYWLDKGAPFWDPKFKPPHWNVENQLTFLDETYL